MSEMNEEEFGRIVGDALVRYGQWVMQNGLSDPLKPLFKNSRVQVEVYFNAPHLKFREGVDVDAYEAEVTNLKSKVEEQKKEIKSLNILLEKQKPKEEPEVEWKADEAQITTIRETLEEQKAEKPKKSKRKRKKK